MQRLNGIDVSEFQGQIDWSKAKKEIQFAIVRGGYGDVVDAYAEYNLKECNKNNIPVGVYWFSYATTEEDAIKEGKQCLTLIKKYRIDYPVYFDFEYDSVRWAEKVGVKITKPLLTKITRAFCETIENAGYYVGIYTNIDYYHNYFSRNLFTEYDKWMAQWGTAKCTYATNMWQHSNVGEINGINGRVDLDISYVDFPKLMRDRGLNHLTEKPAPTPKSLAVGNTVRPTSRVDYNGVKNDAWVLKEDFEVVEVVGDRVVLAMDGTVTGVWNAKNLRRK